MNRLISTLILTIGLNGILSANQIYGSPAGIGCTISFQQVLNQNPQGCSASEDGSICVTINGKISDEFELSINNGTSWSPVGKGTICMEDLPSGSYNLKIREQGGCTVEYSGNPIFLGVDNPVTISEIATTSQTFGELGSIIITATGIPPFQYRIDGGTWQSSEKFFDLEAGTYDVELKDSKGCTVTDEAIVADERCPEFTVTNTTEKNCFSPDGSITITTVVGIRPLTYSNDNGSTWQADSVFTNLSGGTYQLAVKGENGCISYNSTTVYTSFVKFSGSSTVVDIAGCMGDATGEIRAGSFGGQSPKTYSKDNGSTWQSSGTFTGLTAGSYSTIVMDNFGCTDTTFFTITQPIHDTIDFASVNNISGCAGETTGSIALDNLLPSLPLSEVKAGTVSKYYSIDGGLNWQISNLLNNLKAGEYTAVVKVDGCEYPYYLNPVTITEPDSVQFTAIAITPDYGNSLGEITITASGGNNMYEYSIDGGATFVESNSFTALPFGTFDLAVSDGIGCTADSTVTVPNEAVKITNVETTDVTSCFGNASGTITVTATGGYGSRLYSIDGGENWQSSNVFTGLTADSYNIRVKDEAENILDWSSNPVIISEPDEIRFLFVSRNPACTGTSSGEISFESAVGGTGALSYSINGGASYSSNPIFTGLAAGSYTLQISDENDCVKSYSGNPVILTDPPLFEIDTVISIDNTSCVASGNGSIAIVAGSLKSLPFEYPPLKSANATVEHYYYSIDNRLTWHQDTTVFENLGGGLYQAWARNPAGCLAEFSSNPILLSTNNIEISSVRKTNITHCDSTSNGTITINAMGESALQYSIDNGSSWETNNLISDLAPDNYTIVVKNINNCEQTYSRNPVIIEEYKMPVIEMLNVYSPECNDPNSGEIRILDIGGEGGGIPTGGYSIDSGLTWQLSGFYDELAEGIYNAFIKDINGCITGYNSNPISIDIPDEIIIADVITTDPSGETLGSIEIVASGGTEPLYYSIDNGDYFYEENIFNDLENGSYFIAIEDDNGCSITWENNPLLLGGVQDSVEITGASFERGDTLCYGAYQTITVGGDGNYVDFYSGSSTSLIAGTSITFMPGVTINSGSYLSATITTDSSFCEEGALKSPVVAVKVTEKSNEIVKPINDNTNSLKGQSLKVFPNPNNGNFNIELNGFTGQVDVEICNYLGSAIYRGKLEAGTTAIDLQKTVKGLYFVKTTDTPKPMTRKIIIN